MCNHGEYAVNSMEASRVMLGSRYPRVLLASTSNHIVFPVLWLGWAADWAHASEAEPAILSINMQKRYMGHSFSPESICCG
jgi:hypothetical protein